MRSLLIAILSVLTLSSCFYHNPPDHLTATKILEIQPGMSEREVIDILKEPVRKYGNTFQYTETYNFNYPMLWIHFDSSGVRRVYVKYYDLVDDRGIYGLTRDSKNGNIDQWGGENLCTYFDR